MAYYYKNKSYLNSMYSAQQGVNKWKEHTNDVHFVSEVNAATQIAD
jgi:hypothetical protein